jgi:hypothetical protein
MATVEEIKQDIVDWYNAEYGDRYGKDDSFPSVFYEFLDAVGHSGKKPVFPSGPVRVVELQDAGEGDYSADTHFVFSVGEQLFRIDGHYESWAGGEWEAEQMYEAEPVQVMVTQYQRKKV